jgi:hypothetical protein
LKKVTGSIIWKIILIIFVLIFMLYGIIQFWKNYCFGLIEKIDIFLINDCNILLTINVIIIFMLIIEIIILNISKK